MGVSQTQLVPLNELAPGQVAAIRNQVLNALLGMAQDSLSLPVEKLVVRDIRAASQSAATPGDLDYTYEDYRETTGATGNAYETMTTGNNVADRWVGIYGVKVNEECPISALKFNVSGTDKAIWQLQGLGRLSDWVGISPSAVIMTPNAPFTISRYVLVTSASALVVLKGVVVERRGLVVSP